MLIGTTGAAHQLGPAGVTAMEAAAVRAAVGSAAMVALTARTLRLETVRRHAGLLAASAAALAVLLPGFFVANARLGVAVGSVLAIGTGPLFAGLAEWVLGTAPGRRWVFATAVAVAGVGLMSCARAGAGGGGVDAVGVGAGVLSGAGFGVFLIALRRLADRGASSGEVMTWAYLFGSIPLVATLLADPPRWVTSPAGMRTALYLGVVTVGLAYWLLGRGLARMRPSTAATLSLAEPVTATAIGVVVLDETLTSAGWVGVSLVLVGLASTGTDQQLAADAAVATR
ncbi:MAG TPA: DMT family transporter [Ilumatobacter sp.]|nr:DMT family transporter [Ilumatobacter sp.]